MSKLSRNEPCPCGSGKKYKKCCLQKDEERHDQYRNTSDSKKNAEQAKPSAGLFSSGMLIEEELDLLSNSVVDFIDRGKFDEAEDTCSKLLDDYPEVVDGLERSAMLYEARNEHEKAVEYYKKSAIFMKEHPGYSSELIDLALKKVEQLS